MRWPVIISTLLLLPVLLGNASAPLATASADPAPTFVVMETGWDQSGIAIPTGDGDLWFTDSDFGGIHRIGPEGVTRDVLAVNGSLWGVDGDGGFFVRDWDQRSTLRRVDAEGSQPVTEVSGPVLFDDSGELILLRGGAIYQVAPDGTLTYLHASPAEHAYPVMGPDGALYFGADGAVQRMDLATGEQTVLKSNVRTIGGMALDLAGNVYYVRFDVVNDEGGFSMMRLDPITGIETRLAFEPDDYLRIVGFSGSNLWAVRWTAYGPFASKLGYYVVDSTGFVGFRPSFTPAPAADIEVTDLIVEPASLPAPAEVHGQYVVRFTLRNSGAVATPAAFDIDVRSRVQESYIPVRLLDAPGSLAGNHQLARFTVDAGLLPGETRHYEVAWDASADVGLHELVVLADLRWGEPNVREVEEEDNNWVSQFLVMRTTGSPI